MDFYRNQSLPDVLLALFLNIPVDENPYQSRHIEQSNDKYNTKNNNMINLGTRNIMLVFTVFFPADDLFYNCFLVILKNFITLIKKKDLKKYLKRLKKDLKKY